MESSQSSIIPALPSRMKRRAGLFLVPGEAGPITLLASEAKDKMVVSHSKHRRKLDGQWNPNAGGGIGSSAIHR